MKAFASWAACPCIRNIRLCSVSLIYLASFSFSRCLVLSFSSYFFLYSAIDLALTSCNLFFSAYRSCFFFFLSSSFYFANDYRAAKMVVFFWLIVFLKSYFFLIFASLLASYSFFRYILTSSSLDLS